MLILQIKCRFQTTEDDCKKQKEMIPLQARARVAQ